MRCFYRLVISLLIGVGLSTLTTLAQTTTATPTNPYTGLDILFLVDQSGSMGGIEYHTANERIPATDPNELRFEAVQFAVDWLGSFRARQARMGNPLAFNVAVVNFGDNGTTLETDTEVTLEWQALTPQTLDEWELQRVDLINAVSAEQFGLRNLGNTDFISAFERAFELYEQQSNPAHLQVILVLTDGAPCAPDRFRDPECSDPDDQDEHMSELLGQAQNQFRGENRQIYVVALENAGGPSYWSRLGNVWSAITEGNAQRLESPSEVDEVGGRFNDILIGLALRVTGGQTDTVRLGEDAGLPRLGANQTILPAEDGQVIYRVPPYQQLMTVSLFKSDPNTRLVLIDPNGNTQNQTDHDVTGWDTNIEVWQIEAPLPGNWTIGTAHYQDDDTQADPKADVSIDLWRAVFALETPSSDQPLYRPITVGISITDAENQPFPLYAADSDYNLQGNVTLVAPDGTSSDVPLQRWPTPEDGIAYGIRFFPIASGNYQLAVAATTTVTAANPEAVSYSASLPQPLYVSDINVAVVGLRGTLAGIPQEYRLRFEDSLGGEVADIAVADYRITLIPAATDRSCAEENTDAEALPPFTLDAAANTPIISAALQTTGWRTVCLRVVILDPLANNELPIFDDAYGEPIEVRPVQALAFRLLQPETRAPGDQSTYSHTTRPTAPEWEALFSESLRIRPRWPEQPLTLSVEIVEQANPTAPVNIRDDISRMAGLTAETFFTLRILDERNNDITRQREITLSPTDNPAVWLADLGALPAGDYRVIIEAPQEPIGATDRAFLGNAARLDFTLAIRANPILVYGPWVILGILALLVSGLLYRFWWKPHKLRRNPLRGEVKIVCKAPNSEPKTVGGPYDLGSKRRNVVSIPAGEYPVVDPPLAGLLFRSQSKDGQQIEVVYRLQGREERALLTLIKPFHLIWEDGEKNKYYFEKVRPQPPKPSD